jgi:hypothetical protein
MIDENLLLSQKAPLNDVFSFFHGELLISRTSECFFL